MTSVDWLFAGSTVLSVKDTPASGRAVFVNGQLRRDANLLTTTAEKSPVAHVILKPYRREVCAQCFSYDRGREWKTRNAATGTAYCSENCRDEWNASHDPLMLEASTTIETFIKSLLKKQSVNTDDELSDIGLHQESDADAVKHIEVVWESTEGLATQLRQARNTAKPTKTHRAVLNKAKDLTPDPDILNYTLCGILAAHRSQKLMTQPDETSARNLLPSLFALAEHHTVFCHTPTTPSPLSDYTSSYLVLIAILPQSLLPLVTRDLIINLASRASHNAFSIRPEGNTDGEQSGEFLGWGVWPEASFFNHSCRPNVKKERRGRFWMFTADPTGAGDVIEDGEQLCITYLGGDERDIDVYERRERLLTQWGFWCRCDRCEEEGSNKIENEA